MVVEKKPHISEARCGAPGTRLRCGMTSKKGGGASGGGHQVVLRNLPCSSSRKAWRSCSWVFMTMGPYQATGSWSGLPETRRDQGATTWRKNHPHPAFSPDGKRIYYNGNSGPWTTLHVAERGDA